MTTDLGEADLILTPEGKIRLKQNTCEHHWEADHDRLYCGKCEAHLELHELAELLNRKRPAGS